MFLKVMHDGADEFLAQADSDATYSVFGDVTSCDFKRHPDGSAHANIQCREPIKTAEVPGYAEIQKHIDITGDAFLMNDQGRTISVFKLRGYRAGNQRLQSMQGDGQQTPEGQKALHEQESIRVLQALPYSTAAAVRTAAKQAGGVSAAYLIELLDKAKVAVDA